MVITKEQKDELNAVLKVIVNKDDYEPNVEKKLTEYRRKAKIDGFRPGKVPAGMIKKLYGKSVLVDEINNILSESIHKYIHDENLNILGNPLPSESEQKQNDWDNSGDFEFAFDLGLAPEFEVKLSQKDKIKIYNIIPEPTLVQTYSDNYTKRFGKYTATEVIETGNEMLQGTFAELDSSGNIAENGIHTHDSTIYLEFMKDEEIKHSFIGLRNNAVISFNLRNAFPNNVELASILHMKKEETANINSDFQFTVESISKFENAELNQELFDNLFGENVVTSSEEYFSKLENNIRAHLLGDSDMMFKKEAKSFLLQKADFKLPVEFLKRWILSSNEGKSNSEQIENNFDNFENDLKWQLIKNKIINENKLELSESEIVEHAFFETKMFFEQYGQTNVSDEQIENYAKSALGKEDYRRRIIEQKLEEKVFGVIRESVSLETIEINSEEFHKLMPHE